MTPGYVKQGRPAGNDGTKKRRERGRDEGRVEREGSEEERKKIGWR